MTTYTTSDLEAIGTIEHSDGPEAGRVTIYADPDGGCFWAAADGEQPYQTDVEPGHEATAWSGIWDWTPID